MDEFVLLQLSNAFLSLERRGDSIIEMKIEMDQFNSKVFGIKMGNIIEYPDPITNEVINEILLISHNNTFEHLNMKISTTRTQEVNLLVRKDFYMVDTQIMYQLTSRKWGGGTPCNDIVYRAYERNDRSQLDSIARNAYSLDQFHSDDMLPDSLCDTYYVEWIRNCCDGFSDKVMVIEHDKIIVGYITIDYIDNETALVGLAAVSKQYQRKGYFTYMIGQVLQMLYSEGIPYLNYGTQLANMPVLRVMGRYSGIPISSNHVLHRIN